MKFVLAMSLLSICFALVSQVSALFIRRREAIEKLVEFKVAFPFFAEVVAAGMYPIGSTMWFVNEQLDLF